MITPFIRKSPLSGAFFFLVSIFIPFQASAQKLPMEHFKLGAAVHYSRLHISDNATGFQEHLSWDIGYQLHALSSHPLSSRFSIESGIKGFLFSYEFDEMSSRARNEEGEYTGNRLVTSMKGDLRTYYLSVPVNLQFHPFESSFYLSAGPEISYKAGYSNGTLETDMYTEEGEILPRFHFEEEYTVPEESQDFLLAAKTGFGLNPGQTIPVNFELNILHSLTHYLDPDEYIDSWIRGASFSVSYQLER